MSEEQKQGGEGSLVAEIEHFARSAEELGSRTSEIAYWHASRLAAPYEARWQADRQAYAALVEGLRALEERLSLFDGEVFTGNEIAKSLRELSDKSAAGCNI